MCSKVLGRILHISPTGEQGMWGGKARSGEGRRCVGCSLTQDSAHPLGALELECLLGDDLLGQAFIPHHGQVIVGCPRVGCMTLGLAAAL